MLAVRAYNVPSGACSYFSEQYKRPCQGGGGSHVARLNFKMSHVGVYKCLSLIVGFAVTVAIWPREVVTCRDFILRAVATFWAMSLVRIYPGRASYNRQCHVLAEPRYWLVVYENHATLVNWSLAKLCWPCHANVVKES